MPSASLRARHALVIAQMALSLTLLVGSGLLVRSFLHVTDVDPGFDPCRRDHPGFAAASRSATIRARSLDQFFTAARGADLSATGCRGGAPATTYLPLSGGALELRARGR